MALGGGGSGGRRARRGVAANNSRGVSSSILPVSRPSSRRPSFSVSCWYCDLKISSLNDPLFSFGRRHATFLKFWFSIGTGFGIAALTGVTLILLISPLIANTNFYNNNNNILSAFLPSPSASVSMSLTDAGYVLFSTLVSVAFHEFGHAIAAASEGVQIEYIAVYIAVFFPGALVAFNYDYLQALPQCTTLRIYCAGVWHNAVFCAACALALLLLPLILSPFYLHGENPMVLDVTPTSPLSSYLSPGDIIESVDGLKINDSHQWMAMLTLMKKQSVKNSQLSNDSDISQAVKGYCVPSAWMEEEKFHTKDDQAICLDGLTDFSVLPCFDLNVLDDGRSNGSHRSIERDRQCFNAGDIVQQKKCGKGWMENGTSGSNCICSQDEACLVPILVPGLTWIEITFKRLYSSECGLLEKNSSSVLGSPGLNNCEGTFVFIGDVLSVENSVKLTSYQPRWAWKLVLSLPYFLEKLLASLFHVSLTLALVNSLPGLAGYVISMYLVTGFSSVRTTLHVLCNSFKSSRMFLLTRYNSPMEPIVFLLDGESILEVIIDCIPFLSSRKRALVLKICLFGGSLFSVLSLSRFFFNLL